MKNLFITSLISFILNHCKSYSSFIICLIIILLYIHKYNKINKKHLLLIIILYFNSIHNYSIYNNQVLETYENYVIASVEHKKVIIYTDEIYFKNEKIEVIGHPKLITSSFKEIMKQKNIKYYYDSEDVIFHKTNNIKRFIYNKVISYEDDYLLDIFYGFTDNHLLVSSGLHYSYLNQTLLKILPSIYTNIVLILFSLMFPFKFPLLRILLSNLVIKIKDLSKKDKIGFTYLLCIFLYPSCIYSLSFIIPYVFSITYLFVSDKYIKNYLNKCFLIFIQFYYFYECNLLNILFFDFYRKLNHSLFILGIIQLCLPFSLKLNKFYIMIGNIFNININLFGHVSIIISILFLIYFILSMHNKRKLYMCALFLCYIPLQSYLNPFYSIDFIDVGQGDSILVRAPFNQYNVLIDIPKNKDDEVIKHLKYLGIYKIHNLVFTHEDSDHSGGKESFINNFKFNDIVDSDINNKYFQLVNINKYIYDNENDNSIVYYGNVGGLNVCLMADVSKRVEKDLISQYKLSCDILKVGHHGSKTSTDSLFIQRSSSLIAIISVGQNNTYGHPHPEVIEILKKYHVKILMTSIQHNISIKSCLNLHFYSTTSKEFGIIKKE